MTINNDLISISVSNLDAWFDTMRNERGYCGPVSHWWQNCLLYTDVGFDWRYEGIIIGYLNLYEKTRDRTWLKKAKRAGHDLVRGQLENGNFRNSSFEQNPKIGGTPHEAAVDIGLLRLAKVLKENGDGEWKTFLASASKNIKECYIGKLWDEGEKTFRDTVFHRSFVPNKNATLSEALFLLAELTNKEEYIDKYAIPTVDNIVKYQILDKKSLFYGAIYQMSIKTDKNVEFTPKFFPFYVARCIPALVEAYKLTGEESYIASANIATKFIIKNQLDGGFTQVVYGNGRIARYPQWIAGIGDILRAVKLMESYGLKFQLDRSIRHMLSGQDECGGIRAAYGFAVQTSSQEYDGLPDFRDILHVCGWNDKAFRFLTEILPVDSEISEPTIDETASKCVLKGQKCMFMENKKEVELKNINTKRIIYKWKKGEPWAQMDIRYLLR